MFTETLPSGRTRAGFRIPGGRKISRTFDYAYEAETWATETERRVEIARELGVDVDVALGEDARPTGQEGTTPLLSAYARIWLRERTGSLAHGTRKTYGHHVDGLLRDAGDGAHPAIGDVRIGNLRRSDVESWRTRERAAGTGIPTLNARLKVLRMILRYAAEDRIIPLDPTASLDFLATDVRTARVLSREEEDRLLDECDDDEIRLLVLLGLDAGLRWSEAAAVTTDALVDVDGKPYVSVVQVVEISSRSVRRFTKDGQSRRVPATPRLAAAFRLVADKREERALLFTGRTGGPLEYGNFRHRVWRGLTARAGVNVRGGDRFRFHELRHTCGSRLAANGVPRVEIAKFLGHADEKTTARYVHAQIDGARHDLAMSALVA